ncbi:acyltransferase [Glaesserella parasuis]|uniref:acyltransferase family protein n=1 Tax=Glaesserella parasuis TaxID=738 RepID=UPI00311CB5A2
MSYNKLSYRPEVDGLRALAVLSVFIYHLNENWLTGGFLGVDIFFVISGFLITRIITTEMVEGKFEFKTFYNRRIKRIYPVFILTLFIASIFSSLVFYSL